MVVFPIQVPTVSLVIPVFDEEPEVISKLKKSLKHLEEAISDHFTLEVILVDDGSQKIFNEDYRVIRSFFGHQNSETIEDILIEVLSKKNK